MDTHISTSGSGSMHVIFCLGGGTNSVLGKVLGWGCASVRPVERLMPARKAETEILRVVGRRS